MNKSYVKAMCKNHSETEFILVGNALSAISQDHLHDLKSSSNYFSLLFSLKITRHKIHTHESWYFYFLYKMVIKIKEMYNLKLETGQKFQYIYSSSSSS